MKIFDTFASLPEKLKIKVQKQLECEEKIIWAAQPNAKEYQADQKKIQFLGVVWLFFCMGIAIVAFPSRMKASGILPPPIGYCGVP